MKKQNKFNYKIAIFLVIGIIVFIGAMFLIKSSLKEKSAIEISGYYDSEGKKLFISPFSVVNTIEGVNYITLKINALNKDTVDINLKILNITPTAFFNAVNSSQIKTATPNNYVTWDSNLIDVTPFENTIQNFTVTVLASSPSRQSQTKTSSLLVKVDQNPVINFDLTLGSDLPASSIYPQLSVGDIEIKVKNENGIYMDSTVRETLSKGDIVNLASELIPLKNVGGGILVAEFNNYDLDPSCPTFSRTVYPVPILINFGAQASVPSFHANSGSRNNAVAYSIPPFESKLNGLITLVASCINEPGTAYNVKLTFYPIDNNGVVQNIKVAEFILLLQ